jgi:hypothetical protein
MTPPNFNWFLHAMLFYHTTRVIKRQASRASKEAMKKSMKDSDSEDGAE